MGVFDDKKYDELDWISKAIEPTHTILIDILASLPEEITIDYALFFEKCGGFSSYAEPSAFIYSLCTLPEPSPYSKREVAAVLSSFFAFQIEEDTFLDMKKRVLSKPIKVLKIKDRLDEDDIKVFITSKVNEILFSTDIWHDAEANRMNEVAELLGNNDEFFRTRSRRSKVKLFKSRLTDIFCNNEWNIKDAELAVKAMRWISSYVTTGNGAAYINICKLKVMTHKGVPIYSIEEEV